MDARTSEGHLRVAATESDAEQPQPLSRLPLVGRIAGFAITLGAVVALCGYVAGAKATGSFGFLSHRNPKSVNSGDVVGLSFELDAPLYQRLGGGYPIAELTSRFVDKVFNEETVVKDPKLTFTKAQRPALKYRIWEFLMHTTGGPMTY
eukprot:TRINITY_DN30977_c0_g1_i2.p1 TRINITY_DN30977_c0_g1~~TRINITY_DN30977_c0_g1_i2.p1  ORF type:complete len:149 (+),score=17.26 TRINITY_DN30977_c0_g1_i2:58-504(+)